MFSVRQQEAELAELRCVPEIPPASEVLAARARERAQQGQEQKQEQESNGSGCSGEEQELEQEQESPVDASAHAIDFSSATDSTTGAMSRSDEVEIDASDQTECQEIEISSTPGNLSGGNDATENADGAPMETCVAAEQLESSAVSEEPLLDLFRERLVLALQESGSVVAAGDLLDSPSSRAAGASPAAADDSTARVDEQVMAQVEEMFATDAEADAEAEAAAEVVAEAEAEVDAEATASELEREPMLDPDLESALTLELEPGQQDIGLETVAPDEAVVAAAAAAADPTPRSVESLRQMQELTAQMEALDAMPCEAPVRLRSVVLEAARTAGAVNALQGAAAAGDEEDMADSCEAAGLENSAVAAVDLSTSHISDACGADRDDDQQDDGAEQSDGTAEDSDDLSDDGVLEDLPLIPSSPSAPLHADGAAPTEAAEAAEVEAAPTPDTTADTTVWEDTEEARWEQLAASPAGSLRSSPFAASRAVVDGACSDNDELLPSATEATERQSASSTEEAADRCDLDVTSATDSTMDNTFRTAISDGGAAAVADMADFASSVGGTPIADDASWMDQLSATTASSDKSAPNETIEDAGASLDEEPSSPS